MKRFGRLIVLAMLTASLMVPGLSGTASAQGSFEDLCNEAQWEGEGETVQGYEVVELTGGSGSQIVLGPEWGGATLSGGSGNDILCAWGTENTLDGGSGNDVLVATDVSGNAFYGGSGNDTMFGFRGDYFDGGSGRNVIEYPELALFVDNGINSNQVIIGNGFTPGASGTLLITLYDLNGDSVGSLTGTFPVDAGGVFIGINDNPEDPQYSNLFRLCQDASVTSAQISATEANTGLYYEQVFDLNCS